MKTRKLSDFVHIYESTIEDQIDRTMVEHLSIEYKTYSLNNVILEKYGIYKGCEELVDYIISDIRKIAKKEGSYDNQYTYNRDDLKAFDNIFYNNLIIDIDTSVDDSDDYEDNEELNDELLFDEVYINIYSTEVTYTSLKTSLLHELTHAYNNYMMLAKGNNNYKKAAAADYYSKLVDPENESESEENLKIILYFLLGYERNSFFAQVKGYLDKQDEKIKNPLDAIAVLKECPVYVKYKKVNDDINQFFNGKLPSGTIKDYEIAYEKITGEKKTANQIFKKLKALSDKAMKKLDRVIPKLCIEKLNTILY